MTVTKICEVRKGETVVEALKRTGNDWLIPTVLQEHPIADTARSPCCVYHETPDMEDLARKYSFRPIDQAGRPRIALDRASDEIFLCRKIHYGNNGNFVRFSPVTHLSKKDIISILLRVIRMKNGGNMR